MHEIDSNDEPYRPLTELERQRILAERRLPEALDSLAREEARIAGEFALAVAKFIVRNAGPARRRAIDNRLQEFDLSEIRAVQPVISVVQRAAREEDDNLTTSYKFFPDRVEKDLRFSSDSRFDYQTEADFGDLSRLAGQIHLSVPVSGE